MRKMLIEIYDDDYLENIISIVHKKYDGILLIFNSDNDPGKLAKFYHDHFGYDCDCLKCESNDINSLIESISEKLNVNDYYDLDITGGDETILLVFGLIMAQNKYHIDVHKYDIVSDKLLLATDKSADYSLEDNSSLISEIIDLNGGKIIKEGSYDYSDDKLRNEVIRLFNLLKNNNSDFNRFCNFTSDRIGVGYYQRALEKDSNKKIAYNILSQFKKYGIIDSYEFFNIDNKPYVKFHFSKTDFTKDLYFKSGTCLELYGAFACYQSGYFNDIHNSVVIDLNGVITNNPADPYNEIDIMMLYKHTPVFVSCKNTKITKEFLYEIKEMARQYGGKYAVAMIFSTSISLQSTRQRASEMGVILIDEIENYSLNELKEKVKEVFDERFK